MPTGREQMPWLCAAQHSFKALHGAPQRFRPARQRVTLAVMDAPTQARHQRACGRAEITCAAGGALRHLYQAAPLRWLFPDADPGDPRIGALVNVAGGLAGGDRLEATLTLTDDARFTMTTPAAEKIYRSLGAETEIALDLSLQDTACCEWFPQETILFNAARLRRRFDIGLGAGTQLLAAEMLVLGRAAHGERFLTGSLLDRWRVRRGDTLIWADSLRITDPAATQRFTLDGAGAMATLLLAMPEAARHRDLMRDVAQGSASLVAPDLVVARWLGGASTVRAAVAAAIPVLRDVALGHPPRLPRLWRS